MSLISCVLLSSIVRLLELYNINIPMEIMLTIITSQHTPPAVISGAVRNRLVGKLLMKRIIDRIHQTSHVPEDTPSSIPRS